MSNLEQEFSNILINIDKNTLDMEENYNLFSLLTGDYFKNMSSILNKNLEDAKKERDFYLEKIANIQSK